MADQIQTLKSLLRAKVKLRNSLQNYEDVTKQRDTEYRQIFTPLTEKLNSLNNSSLADDTTMHGLENTTVATTTTTAMSQTMPQLTPMVPAKPVRKSVSQQLLRKSMKVLRAAQKTKKSGWKSSRILPEPAADPLRLSNFLSERTMDEGDFGLPPSSSREEEEKEEEEEDDDDEDDDFKNIASSTMMQPATSIAQSSQVFKPPPPVIRPPTPPPRLATPPGRATPGSPYATPFLENADKIIRRAAGVTQPYLRSLMPSAGVEARKKVDLDTGHFAPKFNTQGQLRLGKSELVISFLDIELINDSGENIKVPVTPGLVSLLFTRRPGAYTAQDLENYRNLLYSSGALFTRFSPTLGYHRDLKSDKYQTIISAFQVSKLRDNFPREAKQRKKDIAGKGERGQVSIQQIADPNVLVRRLRLVKTRLSRGQEGRSLSNLLEEIEARLKSLGVIA